MIDTDKYEGHTEGPWEWDGYTLQTIEELDDGYIGVINPSAPYHLGQRNHPDKQLIADAPLLLAEVKRLRSTIEILAADYDSLILDLGRASTLDLDIEEVYEKHLMGVYDE